MTKGLVLVSTLHDPEGRMIDAAQRLTDRILATYEAVAIAATPGTSRRLVDCLGWATVERLEENHQAVGTGRRHALRMGLRLGAERMHYCDFDRVLHWAGSHQAELTAVADQIERHDYLIIGRTSRAFATHPRVQIDTEAITNHAFSLWYGSQVDISAGSCAVSRRAAELLLRRSTARTNATDAEWPALVHLAGMNVGYVATEGLEFETPDYFQDEVAAAGSLEAWLEARSASLEPWIARTRVTLESLEALRTVAQKASR